MALPKLQNESVRDFANMMVNAHGQANQEFAQLVGAQNLEPQANDVSRALENGVQTAVTDLDSATAVDQQYIHSQVTMHRSALALLDCVMTKPNQNEALTSHLRNAARATVASHLRQARAVEASFSNLAPVGTGTAEGSDNTGEMNHAGAPAGTGSNSAQPPGTTASAGATTAVRAAPDSDNVDCNTVCDAAASPFDAKLRSAVCQPRPAS